MLCSAIELGLGDDAEGIHVLGGARRAALGAPLGPIVGEVVLDVDVKPNRGDALSMVGWPGRWRPSPAGLRSPDASVREDPSLAAADHVSVEIVDPAACPRFAARWAGRRSRRRRPGCAAVGGRHAAHLGMVDVTNYVMHELGQPMHAYDAETVPDGHSVVRRARAGETLETIDHERRALDERMVIADRAAHRPGRDHGWRRHEVTSETRRVIPESAIFHGPTIRNTARGLARFGEHATRRGSATGCRAMWPTVRYG